jgi:hypothetical protein
VISLLLSLLVILAGALAAPAKVPPAHPAANIAVVVRPTTVRTGKPTSVVVLGVPRGSTHVQLVADGKTWPTRLAPHHAFVAHPVARIAGPWELDVRYQDHGATHTALGTVVRVR